MGFWIFMFIITLLIPAALLLTWYLCPKFKTIHNASGYRTKRSMKNQGSIFSESSLLTKAPFNWGAFPFTGFEFIYFKL